MDIEARHYQDQLHIANQERMSKVESKLDQLLVGMTELKEQIKCIPNVEERVSDLEAERNQRKGAQAVLGLIAGAVGAGAIKLIEYFFHK